MLEVNEPSMLKLNGTRGLIPTTSIIESRKQIQDIQMTIELLKDAKNYTIEGVRNRQITSGAIIDWKQFEQSEKVKSQLLLKDAENDEKTIFSYLVEEWINQEPEKVIYRWTRRTSKHNQHEQSYKFPHLLEEEHVYRGHIKNYRKHGNGVYIVVKKFSDNSQRVKYVKGQWFQDHLINGVMIDENGKEQILSSNILKFSLKSKKLITPFLEKNVIIQKMRSKTVTSKENLGTENSASSIKDKKQPN